MESGLLSLGPAGHFHAGRNKEKVTAKKACAVLGWQLAQGQGGKMSAV